MGKAEARILEQNLLDDYQMGQTELNIFRNN